MFLHVLVIPCVILMYKFWIINIIKNKHITKPHGINFYFLFVCYFFFNYLSHWKLSHDASVHVKQNRHFTLCHAFSIFFQSKWIFQIYFTLKFINYLFHKIPKFSNIQIINVFVHNAINLTWHWFYYGNPERQKETSMPYVYLFKSAIFWSVELMGL